MAPFRLILKNEKRKFYKSFSIFILILNALAICLFVYYLPQTWVQQVTGIVAALLAVSVIVYREKMVNRPHSDNGILEVMTLLAVYWVFIGYWWVGVLVIVLGLLYKLASRTPEVLIDDKAVVYPSFPGRTIEWNTLNNLVLKDGLLTIDFANNRIIQQMLDQQVTTLQEQEINEFCRGRITRRQ